MKRMLVPILLLLAACGADPMVGASRSALESSEGYQVFTVDAEGLSQIRHFDGLIRVREPEGEADAYMIEAHPEVATIGGWFFPRTNSLSRMVLDERGKHVGAIGYRGDGAWVQAFDFDDDAIADVALVALPGGAKHLLVNALGRKMMDAWFFGPHPFCDEALQLDPSSLPRGHLPGCPDEEGDSSGGGDAPEQPIDPLDLLCADIGPSRPSNGGNRALTQGPLLNEDKEFRRMLEELANDKDPPAEFPRFHPESPENDYFGEDPLSLDYPYDPDNEENWYSPLNPLGPNYDPNWNPETDPAPPPRYPLAPPDSPRPGPDEIPSAGLELLCQHRADETPSIVEQMAAALRKMCVNPAGEPTRTGGPGSTCFGFTVHGVSDLDELLEDPACEAGQNAECGDTRYDELLDARRWETFEGMDFVERCNPLICRKPM